MARFQPGHATDLGSACGPAPASAIGGLNREPQEHGKATLDPHHRIRIDAPGLRSEEHTSELQSLMRISYAVFCLKKKTTNNSHSDDHHSNQQTQIILAT